MCWSEYVDYKLMNDIFFRMKVKAFDNS